MKRWLIVVSLLVAGLLMVGWGGDALAARHSPSLLQKILAMFTPNKSLETVQAPPSVELMQPVETAPAAYALQAVERAEPAQAAPAAGPEPVHTTREKKGDRLKPIQLVKRATRSRRQGLFGRSPQPRRRGRSPRWTP